MHEAVFVVGFCTLFQGSKQFRIDFVRLLVDFPGLIGFV